MPRLGAYGLADSYLATARSGERQIDMQISLRRWDDSVILRVGGRWDRVDKCWVGPARDEEAIWKLQPAQHQAGEWFANWFESYVGGGRVEGFEDIYTLMLAGGRGGGKTDGGARMTVMFAVGCRNRIVWALCPILKNRGELERAIGDLMDPRWYEWSRSDLTWRLWNGTEIQILSGYHPDSLKAGRVDLWLMNEGQRFKKDAYLMARPRLADTRGLGVLTVNPPRDPRGRWVLDFYDAAKAEKLPDVHLFELDAQENPMVDWHSLELLRETFGTDDYRREVLGEFLPVGDVVFYAWSPLPRGNVRPAPEVGDITAAFTRRHLGREFEAVLGIDPQLTPWNAVIGARFFYDESDPEDALTWFTYEALVEGTEDDVVDRLEADGYHPDTTAIILDASAEWQNNERTKGSGGADMFRRRGWKHLFKPDQKMDKNPLITERVAASNARMCNSKGVRRLFSIPALASWNASVKAWENRNGFPYKRSDFAHICDAGSYIVWRFFPRRAAPQPLEYRKVERKKTRRELDLRRF